MSKYILAIDSGTTSVRALLFDKEGRPIFSSQTGITQSYPKPGWVEQDADELFAKQVEVCFDLFRKASITTADISAIGIANQRETTILWDRKTGKPVCPAVVWQCRRSASICEALVKDGCAAEIKQRTGLVPDAYFSAGKLKWLLDNIEGLRSRTESGEILFGTVDSYLIWRLTGGRVHATDVSNASRTMLFNIHELSWDDSLLNMFSVPRIMLPEVRSTSGDFGITDKAIFGAEIPITAAVGDQQAALFGQRCFEAGTAKNTYGTGGFMLMNTGDKVATSDNGLLSTVAWKIGNTVRYALEGSVFVSGAVIQWLRDELELINSSAQSSDYAGMVEDTNGCYFVPAFTGLGAPWWDPDARGIICGLTRGVNKYHITRAALESMAYQTCDLIEIMEQTAGIELPALRVDGGASANDLLMQLQADISGRVVQRPDCVETTALGAAFLAGLAVGFWKDTNELMSLSGDSRVFTPNSDSTERAEKLRRWHNAVATARYYGKDGGEDCK